jgi:hypothetical protein
MPDRLSPRLPLERMLLFATIALGALHAWFGRYSMNVDGMSYLDVGDSFFCRDWANALNAYWSPLYPWTLGIVVGLVKPSPKWEFPLVHLVNLGFFVAALFAFRFLLHTLLELSSEQTSDATPHEGQAMPEWALVILAYPIFWWTALEGETVYDVSPDLAVMACVCLAAAMLLRLRQGDRLWRFAMFGLALALGFWTKAILFPISFAFLGASYFWKRSRPGWGRGVAVAGLAFVCACAPLILLLSRQKGRFTFGDSGRINYAWQMSTRPFTRNWQGGSGSGTPVHPTRQLLAHPPVFEFGSPVVGTYPPWTNPSYWNEGLQWHFNLNLQLEALTDAILGETRLLFRGRPELVAGIVALSLLSGHLALAGLGELWPLLAVSITGLGIYLPLHEEDRFLGGWTLVLFLTVTFAVRFHLRIQKAAAYVAFAVALVMAVGTADYSLRVVMNHMAIPGTGPDSAWRDVVAAEQLRHMGAQPGDEVAVIGDGTGAFWARLGKLHVVAEIMDSNHGSREFWEAPEEVKQRAYDAFARAHAKLVVASCPPSPLGALAGWELIADTPYCVRSLRVSQ